MLRVPSCRVGQMCKFAAVIGCPGCELQNRVTQYIQYFLETQFDFRSAVETYENSACGGHSCVCRGELSELGQGRNEVLRVRPARCKQQSEYLVLSLRILSAPPPRQMPSAPIMASVQITRRTGCLGGGICNDRRAPVLNSQTRRKPQRSWPFDSKTAGRTTLLSLANSRQRSLLRVAFECTASTRAARQPGDSARFWLRLPESVVQNPGALASQLASPQSAVLETAYQKAGHAAPLVCELDNFQLKVKICFVFPAVEWANCANSQLQSAALDVSYKIV
ncbi:Hypothetical_protein [Hexamita inflata]|uniref:Hypothetical_protein n=1 Tax=Hexamita inflata TaxID=28002 RepID=A0AA86VAM8_9EUKA|nr:Hypothetical protein HINF_LOCUS48933 [Hexamita inflata]